MAPVDVNWLAVLVAALSSFAVGGLWYSPVMFAKPWMAAIGKTEEEIREGANVMIYVLTFVGALVIATALSYIVDWAQADSIVDGMLVGLIVGVGINAASYFITYQFEHRPPALLGINVGHDVLRAVVMGAILAGWQ